jgi:hypothetical protein
MELQKHAFILDLAWPRTLLLSVMLLNPLFMFLFLANNGRHLVFRYFCYHFLREGGGRTGDSCHGLLKSTLSIDLLVKLDSAYSSFLKCRLNGRKLSFKFN